MKRSKTCPRCRHEFKNFKWRWDYHYEEAAGCPKCSLQAYKWQDYIKEHE